MWTLLLRCECHYVQLSGESIRCHDMVKYLLGSSSPSLLPSPPLPSHPPHTHLTSCFFPADQSLSVLSALPYLVHLNVSYNKLTAILDFQPPKNLLVCTETAYMWECSIATITFLVITPWISNPHSQDIFAHSWDIFVVSLHFQDIFAVSLHSQDVFAVSLHSQDVFVVG